MLHIIRRLLRVPLPTPHTHLANITQQKRIKKKERSARGRRERKKKFSANRNLLYNKQPKVPDVLRPRQRLYRHFPPYPATPLLMGCKYVVVCVCVPSTVVTEMSLFFFFFFLPPWSASLTGGRLGGWGRLGENDTRHATTRQSLPEELFQINAKAKTGNCIKSWLYSSFILRHIASSYCYFYSL